jgi:hypothetical protein
MSELKEVRTEIVLLVNALLIVPEIREELERRYQPKEKELSEVLSDYTIDQIMPIIQENFDLESWIQDTCTVEDIEVTVTDYEVDDYRIVFS